MPNILLCQGTALALPLKDASVHCVVTSPPYYGLRDYGTGTWQGGDADCDHRPPVSTASLGSSMLEGGKKTTAHQQQGYAGVCGRCGATRVDQQLGLEASPESYVAAMVQVFREVRRVLHPTGTCWIVLGDSYNAAGRSGHGTRIGYKQGTNRASANGQDAYRPTSATLGDKQLLGMPWRVALAMQSNGWILRSAITWCKAAPMPESMEDRPTRATEMVFLFAKQPFYFYDATAVRVSGGNGWHGSSFTSGHDVATKPGLGQQPRAETTGHNLWDYWVLSPEPTGFPHYACMPTALVRRCLLAGAPSAVCQTCGAPWRRDVSYGPPSKATTRGQQNWTQVTGQRDSAGGLPLRAVTTTGFAASCTCNAGTQPCTVFDPFCGSGTSLLVARELGHHAIGIDLSWPYLHNIARERLGLAALAAWTHGQTAQPVTYADLPLFGARSD